MKSGIYRIISTIDNIKFYIGSTVNFYQRKSRHFGDLSRNKHSNILLQNYYNKYGNTSLAFEILEEIKDIEFLVIQEQKYIDKYNPVFNIRKIAESNRGLNHSEETKLKISISNTGKKVSEVTKQKMKEANIGKKVSDETKLKLSNLNKGRKQPLQHTLNKIKISTEESKIILDLYLKGYSYNKLGKIYNVRGECIKRAINRLLCL